MAAYKHVGIELDSAKMVCERYLFNIQRFLRKQDKSRLAGWGDLIFSTYSALQSRQAGSRRWVDEKETPPIFKNSNLIVLNANKCHTASADSE